MTRLTLLVGAIAVSLGLMAGCGETEDPSPPAASVPATTTPSVAAPAVPEDTTPEAVPVPEETGPGPSPTTPPAPPAATSEVTVFFADAQGALVAERHPGPVTLAGAFAALADGPRDPALAPSLPPGTRLLSAAADAGVARLDLSAEFAAGYPSGGAAAELAVLGPIVYSATAVPEVSAVALTVEGATPSLAGSQYDLSVPLVRDDLGATLAEGS